ADCLLHVVDASSPAAAQHHATTVSVLTELGAGARQITVFNKLDQMRDPVRLAELKAEFPGALFVSAHTGEGLERLREQLDAQLESEARPLTLLVPHTRYDLVARLHQAGAVRREQPRDEGVYIEGLLPERLLEAVRAFVIPAPAQPLRPMEAARPSSAVA